MITIYIKRADDIFERPLVTLTQAEASVFAPAVLKLSYIRSVRLVKASS